MEATIENTASVAAPPLPEVPAVSGAPQVMFDRAVMISVELHGIGDRKKVPSTSVEVDADKDLIGVSKKLLDSPELKAVKKLDGQIRSYLYGECVQSGFRMGFYMVPISSLERVEAKLKEFRTKRVELVEAFLLVYPEQILQIAGRLRAVFSESDYPSAQKVRDSFWFDWQYITFGVPGRLREVSKELFESELQKSAAKWSEVTLTVQTALREAMAELVGHLVDRLTGVGDDGKAKTFQKGTIDNLKEFLDGFKDRDITNDAELDALVEEAKQVISGVTPKDLRKNETLRGYIAEKFTRIKNTLDVLMVDKPARLIDFEDE